MVADVFSNFCNTCLEIYGLDPTHFLSVPGLGWPAALLKTKVKLNLSTNINILLMVEKSTRGRICHVIHQYAKANNKYMKHKQKEPSYLNYWDVNNLYGWAMSQKLPVGSYTV